MNNNKQQINNDNTNNEVNIEDTVFLINETYDKLSYFDLYGNSVIIFIFVTLFVFIVFSYCKVMQTKEDIADDWINQRCKPQNILFAGLITHPEGKTAFQYTNDNFQYCVQSILTNISNYALQPFQFMINSLTQVFQQFANSIQQIREVINRLRNSIKEFTEDVLSRILNIMIPIQKMFISLMDIFQKIQGTMTAGLYTMLGSYYTLQALMGAILELIIKVLMSLVIIIVGLWILPFTWPAAAGMSAVFLAISIPLDINVGDKLANGSYVTAKMKVTSENMKIYKLNNIIVSESHLIKYKNNWIRVGEHPTAQQIDYNKDFLYCLNTSNKVIELNGITFSDWDEIDDIKFNKLNKENNSICNLENIHEFLDDGYKESTFVKLYKTTKEISKINVGDILENGSLVYGLVELEARKLRKYTNKTPPKKLYHLLTTNGSFTCLQNKKIVDVKDYNNLIDKFII